jgi:hypothetical protein
MWAVQLSPHTCFWDLDGFSDVFASGPANDFSCGTTACASQQGSNICTVCHIMTMHVPVLHQLGDTHVRSIVRATATTLQHAAIPLMMVRKGACTVVEHKPVHPYMFGLRL